MMSRKMSFFEFWRSKKERGALLERANQLRLLPSQLKRLLGDSGVRAALQNVRMASLLPPVGTEVFRRFTPASLEEIKVRHEAEEKERENRKNNEVDEKESPKPARDLEAEKPLPFIYSGPPPELLNTPLEELDPFYQSQKTFIVLGKGNVLHRFNAEPSCYLLSPFSPLRTAAINVLIHSLVMLMTILTNCVFMMISNPPAWTQYVEYVSTIIFTSEVVIKVASRGFCVGKFTFLRDPWNWLDVMVVITAYLSEFVDLKEFLVLVTVPRVLKLIALSPGLKTTVRDLVQSVKRLVGVFVLMVFCLSILAVISLELYMGILKNKCVVFPLTFNLSSTPGYYDDVTESSDFNFTKYIINETNWYFLPGQLDPLLCGNSSHAGRCPEGYTCLRAGRYPNYGFSNFDSFGWSLLSVFRLMMHDFWENLVLLVLRAHGTDQLYIFMVVIFPVCFCILSLIVAVVAMASCEREEAAVAEAKQKEEEFSQILEVLRRSEEEEQKAGSRAALSEKQDAENKNNEQKRTMEGVDEDQRSCPPCWFVCADLFLKWNCCGCWRWLKQRLYTFVMNPFFDLGIQVCLIINALFMAMEHYPMTPEFESMMVSAHLVFTAIFVAEMVVKVVAMDPHNYFQVGWNIFDSIIVVISLVELGLADVGGLSVVRCFRLMRILRLARWWPEFHLLMKIIWASVRALRHLTFLLLIVIFVFTVVGMQLFRTDYRECVCRIAADCELPRWHMADFSHTLLIILRVLFGEWIETMWDCMEVSGQATCLIFFMMVIVIGNLLVLNLFVTLLLGSFCGDVLPAPEQKNKEMSRVKIWFLEHVCSCLGKKNHVNPQQTAVDSGDGHRKEYLALNFVPSDHPGSEVQALTGNRGNLRAPIATAEIEIESKMPEEEEKNHDANVQKQAEVQQDEDDDDDKGDTPEDCCCDKCYRCCPLLDIDTSQGTGRVWSNFRRACLAIVQHRCFEIFIIVIIVLSSATLVFEDIHLQHRPILKAVVETADQVYTYLFLLEMLLKWIAFGLKRYFSDAWCCLDFLILDVFLISLVASMLGFSGLGTIQFLRTLRALGPLRVLSRFKGMRVVVQSLVRSVPSLIGWLLVSLTVWLIFSILGVNLFAGKFFYCFNVTSEEWFRPDEVENRSQCLLIEEYSDDVHWLKLTFTFDTVASGYLSLLQVAASGSWADIIYAAVDATQVESQPAYEANPYMYLYFICFIIIGCFFTLVFLIRVIIDNLQRDKIWKYNFMTEQQHRCSMSLKRLFPKKPQKRVPRPQNCCQARLFDLVTSPYYEVVMVVVVCLNMVSRMLSTYDDSPVKYEVLYFIEFTFILIFLIEFILKIIALRKHYFKDGWNVFDFVVLLSSIVGLFVADLMEKYFTYPMSPNVFPLLRVGRVGRVLYFIRWTRGIRKLLLALMRSLPAVFNISLVLFLLMFTWSVFGMWNFPYVKRNGVIDDMLNFETFWSSLLSVYTISTTSGWGGLLRDTIITPPDCDSNLENPGSTVIGDCGKPAIGIIFITTYIILSSLLVLHMYIVVILETFNSEDTDTLSDNELQMFYKTWTKFDPHASQFIHYSQLSEFCDALQDPLRIPKPNTIKLIHMDLPLFPGDKVHCVDVLLTLATQVLDGSAELDALKARTEEKFKANSTTVLDEPISSTLRRKQEEVAATLIQRAYRRRLLQHRDGKETAVQAVNGGDVSGSAHQGEASQ